ncbi:hypothetical protein Tco_0823787 [Tanacetum coccineum]|uniref:Uncharacterized protein n=1 Tax=Tanacetum coccineum TaxID=301880 RepID=A0ABQ5AJU9_9ASTR
MLEKHLYDSWKSIMELYMMNRPHGRMILASVEKGPLVWPSITEDGVTRLKEYVELTPEWLRDALTSQSETEITSDSNIIPYSQYLSEAQQEIVQNSNSLAQQDVMILSMFEQLTTQVTHCTNVNLEYKSVNQALTTELDRYKEEVKDLKEMQNVENSFSGSNEQYAEIVRLKQNLFEQVQEKDSLMKTVSDLKNGRKQKY